MGSLIWRLSTILLRANLIATISGTPIKSTLNAIFSNWTDVVGNAVSISYSASTTLGSIYAASVDCVLGFTS